MKFCADMRDGDDKFYEGPRRRQLRESDVAEFFALVESITDKIEEA